MRGRLRREPHGRNLGQGPQGARSAATHHHQRRVQTLSGQGAVLLHAQRTGRHRGRHSGLQVHGREIHALCQCGQHRQGLGPHLPRGRSLRDAAGHRTGKRFGRHLPAGRTGAAGDEDRTEAGRSSRRADALLHLRTDRGRWLRGYPLDHGVHRLGRLRDLRLQRRRRPGCGRHCGRPARSTD